MAEILQGAEKPMNNIGEENSSGSEKDLTETDGGLPLNLVLRMRYVFSHFSMKEIWPFESWFYLRNS